MSGRQRIMIEAGSKPRLARHIKMRHDKARNTWTILGPERVFTPDAVAVEVLQLCDGVRSVEAIAAELARAYDAQVSQILDDVVPMLQDLADKGVLDA